MYGLKLVTGEIVVDCDNGANIVCMRYKEVLNDIAYWNEFDFDDLDIWYDDWDRIYTFHNEDILEVYNKEELIKALGGSTIRFRLAEETAIEIYYTEFDSLAEALTAFEYASDRLTDVDKLNGRKNSVEVYEVIGNEEFVLNIVK